MQTSLRSSIFSSFMSSCGFVVVVGVLAVGFRTECTAVHFSKIAWDTDGVVGTI